MFSVQQKKPSFSTNFVTNYFQELAELGPETEVTTLEDSSLSFTEGVHLAASLINRQNQRQRKVIFIGNGGSATVASHQAIDFWRNGNIPAVAFNDSALLTCISNDFGYEEVFSKPIATFTQAGDILFSISSSGQSKNILAGVRQAKEMNCHTITLSAFEPDNPLRQLGDLNFYVPTLSYGLAEIVHLSICHCILDGLIQGALSSGEAKRNSQLAI